MAEIRNKEALIGRYVTLREVDTHDAAFILSLRLDEKKARFLMNRTENDLQKQIEYIKKYKTLNDEWYFIIESKDGRQLGTICIYDIQGNSFGSGRWLMSDEATSQEVTEGELLMKNYGFNLLGFENMHFDVKKDNKKVLRFHKLWQSKIVKEDDFEYFFTLSKKDFDEAKSKIEEYLYGPK